MAFIDLEEHLGSLDHGLVADLVGDARVVELIRVITQQQGETTPRGRILLDALGGVRGILDDRTKRRALFITLSKAQEQELKEQLEVSDLYDIRLTAPRRERLFVAFGASVPEKVTSAEKPLARPIEVAYGLFPHQTHALLDAAEIFARDGRGRVMLHMPTGAGKTRTAMHLICRHLNSRSSGLVVWLVSGVELCEQAAQEFETAWSSLGERPLPVIRLWGGNTIVDAAAFRAAEERSQRELPSDELLTDRWPSSLDDGVIVASLESMLELVDSWQPNEALARAEKVSLVVFDEAHRAVAPSYLRVLNVVAGNSSLLGLSATPGRHHYGVGGDSDSDLVDLFGGNRVVLKIPSFESPMEGLIAQGYLSRLRREELQVASTGMQAEDLAAIRARLSQNLDLNEETLKSFGLDGTRNLQIVMKVEDLIEEEGHARIIVFAPSVFASELLANLLRSRGGWAESITAKTPTPVRETRLKEYRSDTEQPRVLCNYGVLTTGFDAPKTSAVLIARPTTSIVLLSQMAGRATRGPRVGGTAEAVLVTVVDTAIPELSDVVRQFHAFDEAWNQITDQNA